MLKRRIIWGWDQRWSERSGDSSQFLNGERGIAEDRACFRDDHAQCGGYGGDIDGCGESKGSRISADCVGVSCTGTGDCGAVEAQFGFNKVGKLCRSGRSRGTVEADKVNTGTVQRNDAGAGSMSDVCSKADIVDFKWKRSAGGN